MPAFGLLWLLSSVLSGCDRGPEPAATSSTATEPTQLRDGIGVRAGQDVTGQPGRSQAPASDSRPVIVAFGDSLTAGFGVAPESSYPAQLQQRLDESGYRVRILNAGVSGETSAGALRRVEWVLKARPRLVIVEFGGNDGLRGVDLAQTRENLDAMVARFKAAGVGVIVAGMKLPPNYGADYTERFVRMYGEVAAAHGATLMPFFLEGVAGLPSLNQADGIHPTEAGYRMIVENVLKVLQPQLDRAVVTGSP